MEVIRMTFQKIKETVVDNQKRLTMKQLTKLVINLALAFIGICLTLGLLTYVILGFSFTFLIIVFSILAYNWICNIFVEDESSYSKIEKFARFWWISYILFVVVFFVLKMFRFL